MDSPGNDLESIAGQVACGCNIVIFTTGNGAITNFPFVPTVKVLTTTNRYNLLSRDMDINAGVYLDGTSMDKLGETALKYVLGAASGSKTKGELAGHHQVQIWREWSSATMTDSGNKFNETTSDNIGTIHTEDTALKEGDGIRKGVPIKVNASDVDDAFSDTFAKLQLKKTTFSNPTFATERIGMVLPTSLCSSHVSQMLADKITAAMSVEEKNGSGLSRVVALPHTEGCGRSSGVSEEMAVRTILGYALHPMVACACLVEHGCEKTHNDHLQHTLKAMGKDPSAFGYASIQMDGGIEGANTKIQAHFSQNSPPFTERIGSEPKHLRVGFASASEVVPPEVLQAFGEVAMALTSRGASVVVTGAIAGADFYHLMLDDAAESEEATLGYGQAIKSNGLHVMHSSSTHVTEVITGLGATGVEIIVLYVANTAIEPHPFIPVIQATTNPSSKDTDISLADATDGSISRTVWSKSILEAIVSTATRTSIPKLFNSGCSNIQISRGENGISL